MQDLLEKIRQANGIQIEPIRNAVLQRYRELYPEWEIDFFSIEKCGDRNQQLDSMIAQLEYLKE